MSDPTTDGKTLRFLTVVDESTRRGLWIECARHLTSFDLVRVLEQRLQIHGAPGLVKSDNSPKFVAKKRQAWLEDKQIGVRSIDPGSLWRNGHNERFNGVFRDSCLNRWLFSSPLEARRVAESWLCEYNEERPHGSLGGLLPFTFFERWEEAKTKEAA